MTLVMGLWLRKKSGHDGQIDCYPRCNVRCGNGVGRARETTTDTRKPIPSRSVGSGNMMTDWTFLGSIGRIDVDYRHASDGCLVLDELPKLVESPAMLFASLSLRNRHPLPNTLEIFLTGLKGGVSPVPQVII